MIGDRYKANFLLVWVCLAGWFTILIFAKDTSHKCSHWPPTIDEKQEHIWLNDANFSASEDNFGEYYRTPKPKQTAINAGDANISKTKRQISSLKENSGFLQSSILNSMWIGPFMQAPKRARQLVPSILSQDELVPMKIQVHYDASVHELEGAKFKLIVDIVMPTVIRFFEGVLLLKKDDMMERFRMDRRCPNNTIYYANNPFGGSKAYCKDRCLDYAICGEMNVPRSHLSACSYCNSTSRKCITDHKTSGKGVLGSQLLLYVSANQTPRCSRDQTIAYAAHCAQDPRTDRPTAGHANLCPSSISTDPKDLKALIATVKHELTHVLGFSVSLFAYYRDQLGVPLTERPLTPGPIPIDPRTGYAQWSDRVIKKYIRKDWSTGAGKIDRSVYVMVTPTVVREVRNHFNCSSLEGAELEDQGSDGTSLTHWEKRLFENEAMTGTHTQNSVYSPLTLAALQDTGWYVANFSQADKLDWGKNLGCEFAKQSCKSWIDERRSQKLSIRPFCDGTKENVVRISCTEDRRSKAVCNMKHYPEPLHQVHRNFDFLDGVPTDKLAHYGGSVDLADYCPFIQEFTWHSQNTSYRSSSCDSSSNNLDAGERGAALEHYGPEARCFEHGGKWEQKTCMYKRVWHHFGAGCYRYTCQHGHLSVTVGNYTYNCYYVDQQISVEQLVNKWFYNGTLICPACEKMCGASNCVSYDRQLVDKILSMELSSLNASEFDLDYASRVILDDLMNSIDSSADRHIQGHHKPLLKLKTSPFNSSEEAAPELESEITLMRRYLAVLASHEGALIRRDKLICSSANSRYLGVYSASFTLLLLLAQKLLKHLMRLY